MKIGLWQKSLVQNLETGLQTPASKLHSQASLKVTFCKRKCRDGTTDSRRSLPSVHFEEGSGTPPRRAVRRHCCRQQNRVSRRRAAARRVAAAATRRCHRHHWPSRRLGFRKSSTGVMTTSSSSKSATMSRLWLKRYQTNNLVYFSCAKIVKLQRRAKIIK